MNKTYICAICEEQFETVWSEEDAQAEKIAFWGDIPDDECDVVCDDCFQKINPFKVLAA